jgi:hypothetical protein
MPSNWLSFASLPCDLHDDATCTTRHRSSASFEAKLGNPNLTFFVMKQAARWWCVSSHRLHMLISFEAQTDNPPPTWFWGPNQETVAVIWWAFTKPQLPVLRPKPGNLPTLVLRFNQEIRAPCLLVHGVDHTQYHPTSRSSSHQVPDLCLTIPCPLHQVSLSHPGSRK